MSVKPVLKVENLAIAFDKRVVHDVSLEIYAGKTTAIVGESGSGKTITSMAIMGLLPKKAVIENGTIEGWDGEIKAGNGISMVFQDPMSSLNPSMTVGKQVGEPLIIHQNEEAKKAKSQVLDLFQEVELPEAAAAYDKFPHELSGGQKQRLAIAGALASEAKLMLLDEPTASMDMRYELGLLNHLRQTAGHFIGVVIVIHDLNLAARFMDRLILMNHGEVIAEGAPEVVLDPNRLSDVYQTPIKVERNDLLDRLLVHS